MKKIFIASAVGILGIATVLAADSTFTITPKSYNFEFGSGGIIDLGIENHDDKSDLTIKITENTNGMLFVENIERKNFLSKEMKDSKKMLESGRILLEKLKNIPNPDFYTNEELLGLEGHISYLKGRISELEEELKNIQNIPLNQEYRIIDLPQNIEVSNNISVGEYKIDFEICESLKQEESFNRLGEE